MRSHYDGITIDRLPSGAYRYRARDPAAGRYESATFRRLDEDKERDTPGTGAGDRWAKSQLARYRLGLATAEPAMLGTLVDAYLRQLGSDRPHNRPMNAVHIQDVGRTLTSLATQHPGLDLNKPHAARSAIRDWLKDLKAVHATAKGRVIRRKLTLAASTRLPAMARQSRSLVAVRRMSRLYRLIYRCWSSEIRTRRRWWLCFTISISAT